MNIANDESAYLVSLADVSFTINNKPLVANINLTINMSDNLCLIGPNGAGKSTLVKLILGLIKPSSGHIKRNPNLVIGYVPQSFSVPDILPLRVIDLLKQASKNRLNKTEINILYERLYVKDLLKRQVSTLSGGEKQRVLLTRALLEKPNLLVLDEPMQGLDPESETLLYQFIDSLPNFLQCSLFVVSHDLHWVMRGSHHVICLNKHICCEGQPVDIKDSDEFQQLFMKHNSNLTHQYEKPYIHNHDNCQHLPEDSTSLDVNKQDKRNNSKKETSE